MIDKLVVGLIEKWIPALGGFLQKVAFLAIFLGFLGYFINSLKDAGTSGFTISPIPQKSLNKIVPPPPAR